MKFFKATLFIFVLAFFFAGVTAGVNKALSNRIALNEKTRNSRDLLEVLAIPYPPKAGAGEINAIKQERVRSATFDHREVFRGYNEHGQPIGYAFWIGGKGFWGRIEGLLALDDNLRTIKGIVFTSQNETPGLGARIEEKGFREQFKGIELAGEPEKGKFVRIGKGNGDRANRVDAITGATMTSTLLEKLLNENIREILARKDEVRRIPWPSQHEK